MPYKDPEIKKAKHAEYSKKYYEANKEKIIAKNKVRKRVRRSDWQVFKATLSCVNCGENHPATFDFHHIDRNEKDFAIAHVKCRSFESIKSEKSIRFFPENE
jgi:hypothetical protein